MCAWLGVSKSGYYEWLSRPESAAQRRRAFLREKIAGLFEASDGTYGYRRMTRELGRAGVVAGEELVRGLMRGLGLVRASPGRGGRPPSRARAGRSRTW